MNTKSRNNRTIKALALLLALVLLVSAAPLALAQQPAEDGWLIYYKNRTATTFDAVIVAPAAYTQIGDRPQIETIYAAVDPAEHHVLAAAAEQITFFYRGKTETHWTLTATCSVPDGTYPGYNCTCAVLPGSVLTAAGSGNARIWFDEDVEYRPAEGFVSIDVCSNLLQRDYDREDDTVAVGDTLRVEYSGLVPVEILLNGVQLAALPGGEMQEFTCGVTETGACTVAVQQNGETLAARQLTVITSMEMYKRNLRDGLVTPADIPTTADFVEVGVPAGSLYIPLFKVVAFFVLLRDFFVRLFSFPRITK